MCRQVPWTLKVRGTHGSRVCFLKEQDQLCMCKSEGHMGVMCASSFLILRTMYETFLAVTISRYKFGIIINWAA